MCKSEWTFYIILTEGTDFNKFRNGVLAKLADRQDWLPDLQDWEGHPKRAGFNFDIDQQTEPIGVYYFDAMQQCRARLTVTFDTPEDAAKWTAFNASYAAQIYRAITLCGGSGMIH